jgi:Bacterial surface proteins containing Ig-like domains
MMAMSTPSFASSIPSGKAGGSTITSSTLAVVIPVTGVSVKSGIALTEGYSTILSAKITPANATIKNVTWESSDTAVATVDWGGRVVGLKAGTAEITVTTQDGNKTAACQVTVNPRPVSVTGISLDSESETIDAYTSITLSATVAPENATNQRITWKSSNSAVAKVDQNGEVVGKKAGTATITATTIDGHKKDTCKITVVLPEGSVKGVKLDKRTLTLYEGGSKTLEATITPSDAINQDVTWKSTDTSIAIVDPYGRVTAVKKGTAQILVTTVDGNKMAYCTVTVKR